MMSSLSMPRKRGEDEQSDDVVRARKPVVPVNHRPGVLVVHEAASLMQSSSVSK